MRSSYAVCPSELRRLIYNLYSDVSLLMNVKQIIMDVKTLIKYFQSCLQRKDNENIVIELHQIV